MNPADEYILNQPEPYRAILLYVCTVMEALVPEADLKYKWRIPYFYVNGKPFCYLNASHKRQFVDVAFNKGFYLTRHQHLLVADGGRNTIKSLRYYSLEDIDQEILVDVISEARSLFI